MNKPPVFLVHGYSVRSLDTYGSLPTLLTQAGYDPQHIYLSAFDSLNDNITCDDLALALEYRIREMEAKGVDLQSAAFMAHSTGAIVTRRWMLNRYKQGKALPRHFISLAGANHGSTLAQMGTTQLAYIFRRLQGTSVGKQVLEDLDYGSKFLLDLNVEWLESFNSVKPPTTYIFSLVGDDHSALSHQVAWQMHEDGSDGTVRISGANLNYSVIKVDQQGNQNGAQQPLPLIRFKKPVPHLILEGISHTGSGDSRLDGDTGIVDGTAQNMAKVFPEIQKALNVATDGAYDQLTKEWQARNTVWQARHPEECNSTILFSLQHPGARKVGDSLILIKDATLQRQSNDALTDDDKRENEIKALKSVGGSIKPRQPIQNDIRPSSVSFYVNHKKFSESYPHQVDITISSSTEEITYTPINYEVSRDQAALVQANEFTYVFVNMKRETQGAYQMIPHSQNPDPKKQWPPLPKPLSGL